MAAAAQRGELHQAALLDLQRQAPQAVLTNVRTQTWLGARAGLID
jgi:hypothetical protein